jgi:hypothetical protein
MNEGVRAMLNVKRFMKNVRFHGLVLLKGMMRMLFGTATAGLMGLAVYGFVTVSAEGGYMAVGDFLVAMATVVVAGACMYAMGCGKKGAKK